MSDTVVDRLQREIDRQVCVSVAEARVITRALRAAQGIEALRLAGHIHTASDETRELTEALAALERDT